MIIALLVIIILALIVAAILLWFNNQSDNNGTSSSSSSTSSSSSSESSSSSASSSDVTESISITSPSDGGSVNGDVTVEGTATATLDELTIQIHDDNGLMLGSGVVDLSSGEIWSVSVAISKSPGTLAGTIKVFPTTEGETSTLAQMVNVNFDTQEVADRLKLYAPLSNQLMSDTKILFRGEMQDFFEGTFSIRLKDESGAVIFTDSIMADGENYGQFATFEKLVDVGTIPAAAGSTGTWEIYEVSAMDGSTIILLSVPVRFVE